MARAFSRRATDDDRGFTLVELLVVVLVIALLIAIAIPTFIGARNRAYDRAAQTLLRHALTAEQAYFADNNDYTWDTNPLNALEPGVSFLGWSDPYSASAATKQVQVWYSLGPSYGLLLETTSQSGKAFLISAHAVANGSSPPGIYYLGTSGTGWPAHQYHNDPASAGGVAVGWKRNGF